MTNEDIADRMSEGGFKPINSAFSETIPNLQIVWDSTSFRALMFCARSYQLGILQGWRGEAVDLEFGIMFATGTEVYAKERLKGSTKDEATTRAIQAVVEASWLPDDGEGHAWGGVYTNEWHCLGTEKYRNSKGNAAKCPYSHKGKWFPGSGPSTCGECGSETEHARHYLPNNSKKNRLSLVTAIAWYCFEQPDTAADNGLYPVAFPDGTPAVELSFKLPLPYKSPDGQPYILSGHMDAIKSFGPVETFVTDNKTTGSFIGPLYWKQYSPNIQVDIYDLAGSLLYPQLAIKGVAIEATQLFATGGARFAIHPFYRTESQREETLHEIGWWLKQAERYAADNFWPMNKTNCKICNFNGICSKDPAQRERYLKADFVQKHWNPAEER